MTRPSVTPRQLEVLQLLADGRTTSEIATDLYLSELTVRSYVKAFLIVLGARHRAHAVGIGYQTGLLPISTMREAA